MKSVRSGNSIPSRPKSVAGTRLALTACRKFVELQALRGRSQNVGSTFTFAALVSRVETPDPHHIAVPFLGH